MATELILSIALDDGDFDGIDLRRSTSSVTVLFFVLLIVKSVLTKRCAVCTAEKIRKF